jgi:hypothetical protein
MLGVTAVHLSQNSAWYFARAGGLVGWALLTASVLSGLVFSGRLTRKFPPPAWNLDIHRFLGGLAVIFVTIHVVALMADRFVDFGLAQVLVPFASHWRPAAVAWGICAFYVLLAVELTSLAMRWVPRKLWHQIHLLTLVLFVTSTIHAFQSGTDTRNPIVRVIGAVLLLTVLVIAALRVAEGSRRAASRRPAPAAPVGPASLLGKREPAVNPRPAPQWTAAASVPPAADSPQLAWTAPRSSAPDVDSRPPRWTGAASASAVPAAPVTWEQLMAEALAKQGNGDRTVQDGARPRALQR